MAIYRKNNRHNKRKAKLGRDWCQGCDRALVSDGGKCRICHNRKQRRNKKPLKGDV